MSFVKKITDDIFLFWKNCDRITRLKPTGPEAIKEVLSRKALKCGKKENRKFKKRGRDYE